MKHIYALTIALGNVAGQGGEVEGVIAEFNEKGEHVGYFHIVACVIQQQKIENTSPAAAAIACSSSSDHRVKGGIAARGKHLPSAQDGMMRSKACLRRRRLLGDGGGGEGGGTQGERTRGLVMNVYQNVVLY